MALTDAKVRAAKPLDKSYKLTDGDGMHLMYIPTAQNIGVYSIALAVSKKC